MNAADLEVSALNDAAPPADLSALVQSLWHARAGNWHRSHELCQDLDGKGAAWVHAHLHRVEGDFGNAAYWYARAGKPAVPNSHDFTEEWRAIAADLV